MAKNVVSGNAQVGVQAGNIDGDVVVSGGKVFVNGFEQTSPGTWLVDGVSVGMPRRSGCGCPGADTFSFRNDQRVCIRCNKPF